MFRVVAALVCVAVTVIFTGCGPRPRPVVDAGVEDAGLDAGVDAGRPRGDDPATGWSTALVLPLDAGLGTRFGASVASAGDQYGQPLIAALVVDPNDDGNTSDSRVFFSRWNGVAKAFEAPQIVEVVGAVANEHPHRQVSVARDPDTGRLGLAYVKADGNQVRFAFSDDEGANFSLTTASDVTAAQLTNPSLALKAGVAHLAYTQGSRLLYRSRTGTGAWLEQLGSSTALNGPVSLALDSAGLPAVAFFQTVGTNAAQLVFWRPGAPPSIIATSDPVDVTVDDRRPSVSLTFSGQIPHVAYHLRQVAPLPMNDDTAQLFYSAASDASGSSWKTPVAVPRTRTTTGSYHSTLWYQALAVDSTGQVTLAADFARTGGSAQCQGPKLSHSVDGAAFDTCAPPSTPAQFAGDWVTLWPYKPGKHTLIFHYDQRGNPALKPGIVMWREP
jgi:hypothetical protein